MKDAAILIEDMMTWTTDELMLSWHFSDDPVERYAAQHLVLARFRDLTELMNHLIEYGQAHAEQMTRAGG